MSRDKNFLALSLSDFTLTENLMFIDSTELALPAPSKKPTILLLNPFIFFLHSNIYNNSKLGHVLSWNVSSNIHFLAGNKPSFSLFLTAVKHLPSFEVSVPVFFLHWWSLLTSKFAFPKGSFFYKAELWPNDNIWTYKLLDLPCHFYPLSISTTDGKDPPLHTTGSWWEI